MEPGQVGTRSNSNAELPVAAGDAMRLQANAERARRFAMLERNRATLLRLPR